MRLTLRTLLAYLDNTLEASDAKVLKNKLGESGFATQLVQRIHRVLADKTLSAPKHDAVGPVEEANVIGEYLDSTLPGEQVAEIERACLESDVHLAEAASCHQILSIVVKKPAEFSQDLRLRVYGLPDRQPKNLAAGASYSAVEIPAAEPSSLTGGSLQLVESSNGAGKSVRPVGPDDSGVSDAPTRLRQAEVARGVDQRRPANAAGSRPRTRDNDTRIYGGSIRTSRITPWLVSLGLTAVLLFVLSQLFKPLLDRRSVDSGTPIADAGSTISPPVEQAIDEVQAEMPQAPTTLSDAGTESASFPAVADADSVANPDSATNAASAPDVSDVADAAVPEQTDIAAPPSPSPEAAEDAEKNMAADVSEAPVASETLQPEAAEESPVAENPPMPVDEVVANVPPPPPPQPPATSDVVETNDVAMPPEPTVGESTQVATLISDDALVTAKQGEVWVRLKKDAEVFSGTTVFCAPTFRALLTVPGGELTLIGPCQVRWVVADGEAGQADGEAGQADVPTLVLDFGRLLIASTQSDFVVPLEIGAETVRFALEETDSAAAVELTHYRSPGDDPLVPENRLPISNVFALKGKVTIDADGSRSELPGDQERRRRGRGESELIAVTERPAWIEPQEAPLEASARSGLLELLDGIQPLELQLREATRFRRSEVAALAGRSLLGMGLADVYFVGDGLFNEPKQRTYWPDHFAAMLAAVDHSSDAASQIHETIVRMDSANSNALLRFLTGFSQKQLEQGADVELVQGLDSPSMAVRVLAIENLSRITGTTLYYRPDQENAVKRSPIVKKWEVRLRKGDIRWQP